VTELKVAIIGCGPSGMVIAHACDQMGVPFTIYAPKDKSHISGAQYLHSDIGVRQEGLYPRTVTYCKRGNEWTYEGKIYPNGLPKGMKSSWDKFSDSVDAWPLIGIYDYLWERHHDQIVDSEVALEFIMALGETCLTFNTAPLNKLMPKAHFEYETVMICDGVTFAPEDTIVYNGELHSPWYRSSNLWGHYSVEFPVDAYYRAKMPLIQYEPRRIRKPLLTDAVIPGVIASGRYGRWEKGVLVDESYHQAIAEIKARL